jgi:hypothetical protein
MKITNIEFTARRTFNHPTEKFANFQCSVKLSAELEKEAPFLAYNNLRTTAENMVETHKQEILAELENERLRERLQATIEGLTQAPSRIAAIEPLLAAENAKPSGKQNPFDIGKWTRTLQTLSTWETDIAEAQAALAAIPSPKLLPSPALHPGHPDHPDTDANPYFGE